MYSFLIKRYILYIFAKKSYVARNVQQLLFRTRFHVLTKFTMPNGSHMDAHRI